MAIDPEKVSWTLWHPDGTRGLGWNNENHKPHRSGKPAQFWLQEGAHVVVERWFEGGVLHREDGPAEVRRYCLEPVPDDVFYEEASDCSISLRGRVVMEAFWVHGQPVG